MFKRLMRTFEYIGYTRAARLMQTQGYYKQAQEILKVRDSL